MLIMAMPGIQAAAATIDWVDAVPLTNAISWWDLIDGSPEWQEGIYYALSASYALVSFLYLVQFIRIQLRSWDLGWTTQKVFHLMNFILNGLQAVLFGFYQDVFLIKQKALEIALLDLPGLLFFSTCTLLVLFWAEVYYQALNIHVGKLRPSYLAINAAVYILQICIWVYAQMSYTLVAVEIAKFFLAVVHFLGVLGFLVYGGRLYKLLLRFPIESKGLGKKLKEVGLITIICSTCFLIRSFMVTLSAFNKDADLDVLDHPILNFIYYFLVEIIPSVLLLVILKKLPRKRVSDNYQPIK